MLIGICKIDLIIAEGHSLKDKRRIIKSLTQRLQNKFGVSAAEVGHLDMLRRSELCFAVVGNDAVFLEKRIAEAISFIEWDGRVQAISIEREIIPF